MSGTAASLRFFFLLLVVTFGCGNENPLDPFEERELPAELKTEAASVVDGNNRFALDLYAALKDRNGNLFLSPYSISTALAMTYAGARGTTEEEMARVLHFEVGQDQLHPIFGALQSSLNRGTTLKGYELSIANRLWGDQGYTFLEPFLATTRDHYDAELARVDFTHSADQARRTINQWVEEKTRNRIKDLLPPGSVNSLTRLVLTNAIYFKGLWEDQFDVTETREGRFFPSPNEVVQVPMMYKDAPFPYASLENADILELPYKGKDLSMIVVLPHEKDGLAAIEGLLTLEIVERWFTSLQPVSIMVHFPRFRITSEFTLIDALTGLGMPSAFDEYQADFSGMNGGKDLYISAVVHKAFVNVNEEGTEAAAATGVVIGVTSAGLVFAADHPFLFFIRDNVTGSLLFMGRVSNPLA